MQHRGRDMPRFTPIFVVMFDIQGRSRAVLFADRVYPSWIAIRFRVLRSYFGAEGALAKWIVKNGVRSTREVFLRKRCFLREKDPWPVCHGELCIGVTPSLGDRYDVEYGQPLHFFRMVESEAVGDAPTTVVSDEIETGESKFIHYRNEFVRHRSLRIGVVIRCGGWHAAAPIAAEIDANHGVAVRKARCHETPHEAGPGKAVHHEQRRSFSISSYENGVVAGLDFRRLEVTQIGRCRSAGGLGG